MSRLGTYWHVALSMLCGTVTLLSSARAHAASCNERDCDFQEDSTVIRSNLWSGPCPAVMSRLDPVHHGDDTRAPPNFVRGVCLFERVMRGLELLDQADTRGMRPVTRAIEELQKAQSVPMLPAQRAAAALFEGLMHCKQLDAIAAAGSATTGYGTMERRCAHRAMAKASFARVDHAGLDIRYADPESAPRIDQNIESMFTCQATHLHDGQASRCGMLLSANARELDGVASDVAKDVLPRFFGEVPNDPDGKKLVPHVTALVLRKIEEASTAAQGSREAFERLHAQNEAVRTNLATLDKRLCNDPSCPPGAVGALLSAYKSAIQSVARYITFIDQFMAGFFNDANKDDARGALDKTLVEARNTVSAFVTKRPAVQTLKDDLTRLSTDPSGTDTVLRACRLLFCEIYAGPRIRLDNACRSVDPVSREPLLVRNPLCAADVTKQVIGTTGATTASICREAGFNPALAVCGD
jgi:hypothetical protein